MTYASCDAAGFTLFDTSFSTRARPTRSLDFVEHVAASASQTEISPASKVRPTRSFHRGVDHRTLPTSPRRRSCHRHSRYRATRSVATGPLNARASSITVPFRRFGQFEDRRQQDHLEQSSMFCPASPILRSSYCRPSGAHQLMLCQFLTHATTFAAGGRSADATIISALRRAWLIERLRHHTVVGCDHENRDSPEHRTHRRKRLMPCIEKVIFWSCIDTV